VLYHLWKLRSLHPSILFISTRTNGSKHMNFWKCPRLHKTIYDFYWCNFKPQLCAFNTKAEITVIQQMISPKILFILFHILVIDCSKHHKHKFEFFSGHRCTEHLYLWQALQTMLIEITKLKSKNDDSKGQLQINNKVRTDATHSYVQSVLCF
jgi:hypothetical protein